MRTCHTCSITCPDTEELCPKCHGPMWSYRTPPPPPPHKSNVGAIGVAITVLLVLLVLVVVASVQEKHITEPPPGPSRDIATEMRAYRAAADDFMERSRYSEKTAAYS